MKGPYLIALDQGTTSSRAVIFDRQGTVAGVHAIEFTQIYPQPGWVEHDPLEILNTQVEALQEAVRKSGINVSEIAAIGITNQRETTVLWDRGSGQPVGNAIVWQCRRTAQMVEKLVADGYGEMITAKTGLVPDAYFSGTKLRWMLDQYNLQGKAERGEVCFGTIDSFLIYQMVEGQPHVSDATNAGRTMLYNIHEQKWDEELLKMLQIPKECLPRVVDSCGVVGMLRPDILGREIPVASILGDQHAALFGQTAFEAGAVKNTYGTGCFMLMNTGSTPVASTHGIVTTQAWRMNGKTTYALEGSVFMGGAVMQWLRDELKILDHVPDSEAIARSIPDTGGVFLVPAFTGLGAPWWDMYSRGMLIGMTRGTGREEIIRASLESIAYQTADLLNAMRADWKGETHALQVDGGASSNSFLMQFQADILGIPVWRSAVRETTAFGTAMMAGLATGVYSSMEELHSLWRRDAIFEPVMSSSERNSRMADWHRAVERARDWVRHD